MYYEVINANSSNDHYSLNEANNFAEKEIGEEIFTQEEITQWKKEVFPSDY